MYKPLTDGEFKESALRAYRNEAVVIGLFEEFRGIEEFGCTLRLFFLLI